MLLISPIILCCSAKKFNLYAQNYVHTFCLSLRNFMFMWCMDDNNVWPESSCLKLTIEKYFIWQPNSSNVKLSFSVCRKAVVQLHKTLQLEQLC